MTADDRFEGTCPTCGQRDMRQKLDVSKEPHWLYRDFNVLYRVADRAMRALRAEADPIAAYYDLKAQLERLAPAFTDTDPYAP